MNSKINHSTRGRQASENFLAGYNCSQSVFLAFSDLYPFDVATALRLSSSFGGGMGRLREVCGCVSGMFLAAGLLYGYDSPTDHVAKTEHYKRIQELAASFSEATGSIVCRDILGLSKGQTPYEPEKRTEDYYKKRPCKDLAGLAASILEAYMEEHPDYLRPCH